MNSRASDDKRRPSASAPSDQQLIDIANHALKFFEEVSTQARTGLDSVEGPSVHALASINTFTDASPKALGAISDERRRSLRLLCEEPAIARVVVLNEDCKKEIVYISRATPSSPYAGGAKVANYRAAMGQLAAARVGSEIDVGLHSYRVLERATLRPVNLLEGWDSKDTVVVGSDYGPLTVKSLRELLRAFSVHEDDLDILQTLFDEDRRSKIFVDGIQRSVIEKMGLRDRPLLDEYQDEIFRQPIDRRMVILGPPGTGKTTTLIKRLGLKLDLVHLASDERALVDRSVAGVGGHSASWIMFTPTELLKQYVKEAFARENIPASDLRIQTWADHRRDLARNQLGILRTATGRGMVLKEELQSLQDAALKDPIPWFGDFQSSQASQFWSELESRAQRLSEDADSTTALLGRRLAQIVAAAEGAASASSFLDFDDVAEEVAKLATEIRSSVDKQLRMAFAQELRRDTRLLDDLLAFLSTLGNAADVAEETDDAETEEDDDEINLSRGDREEAFEAYMRAVRSYARAAAGKRNFSRRSRNGRILEWLGSRTLPVADLVAIGQKLQVQGALRWFANPLRQYLAGIPARYHRFRRERQSEGKWYQPDGFEHRDVGPLELDAILLCVLREARKMLKDRRMVRMFDEPRFAALETIRDLQKTQVLVDEATDFSPLQLGCMAALCDPAVDSFLACGDFNQRITEWGTRSRANLHWLFPDLDIREITVTYRHSRQLNDLARRLVELSGTDAFVGQLPPDVQNEGVDPVLARGLEGNKVIGWLAARIGEVERFTRTLPSIAVLVNGEEEVSPLAESLSEALTSRNIRVVACPNGQVVGQENDVRVFDVQHIKGLEFEAVFFVGIDKLASRQPDLFDKYLYVGATRAATYLGMTCFGLELPARIASLEDAFVSGWQ